MKDHTDVLAPRGRATGLLIRNLDEEVLVYDLERNQAHCLNRTAALVWSHCDGLTTVRELVELLQSQLGMRADEQTVWHALLQLGKDHLLEQEVSHPLTQRGMTRRQLMQRAGTVVAAAAVTSIVVPSVAQAASGVLVCTAGTVNLSCVSGPQGQRCQNCVCAICGPSGAPDGTFACCTNGLACCKGVCCGQNKICNASGVCSA
jgi:Coenzyme PQQ synthesis protein D (PqqD)